MKSTNTFGVNFILRQNKEINGRSPVYGRINVNKKCCEIALKCTVLTTDWNAGKGAAKPKNDELRELNTYLEKVRSKIVEHYRVLELKDELLTAEAVKNAYLRIVPVKENMTLCRAFGEHILMMKKILKHGTLKNYYTTEGYLKAYCEKRYSGKDVYLKQLPPEFITHFEHFIRNEKGLPMYRHSCSVSPGKLFKC